LKNNPEKSTRGGSRSGAGRPKGSLNKVTADLMKAARVYTAEALETILAIMRGGDSETVRLAAAKELLDRGHGKAPQPQTGEGGTGPVKLELSWLQPSA
jgi:hypothetical protein